MVSSKTRRRYSLVRDLKETASGYLRESTIHGLSYLLTAETLRGRLAQRAFWLCSIVVAYGLAVQLIARSFREARDFPVISNTELSPADGIPFPAVTVDSGGVVNPWGTLEKLFNSVELECYDAPQGNCSAGSEAVRKDIFVLTSEVTKRFFEVVYSRMMAMTMKELQKFWRKNIFLQSEMKADFNRTVARLSVMSELKKHHMFLVRSRISRETALTVGKFLPYQSKWITELVNSIIEREINANSTQLAGFEANVTICEIESKCSEHYKEAFATLALPFLANSASYKGVRLGDYLSFFSSRVLAVRFPWYNYTQEFLDGTIQPEEERLAEWLLPVTKDPTEMQHHLSSLELARLCQEPKNLLGEKPHLNFMGSKFGCSIDSAEVMYSSAWLQYLGLPTEWHSKMFVKHSGQMTQPPCTNTTMDAALGITGCCRMVKGLQKHPKIILQQMKYAMQPPHFTQPSQELEREVKWIKNTFPKYDTKSFAFDRFEPLPQTTFTLNKYVSKRVSNYNPRMYWSQYSVEHLSTPKDTLNTLFVRSYTNAGFGYTFNSKPFWEMSRVANDYNHAFYNTMFPFINMENKSQLHFLASIGVPKELNMVIQANKYDRLELGARQERPQPLMRIALHDPGHPPDLRTRGLEVKPGYETKISFTPSRVTASQAVKDIDVALRKCKFPSESEGMEIFQEFSQSGCLFECSLRASSRRCGCVPWNYPMLAMSTKVCDYMGVYCFELASLYMRRRKDIMHIYPEIPPLQTMSDEASLLECDCPGDCSSTYYATSVSSTKVETDEKCKGYERARLFALTDTWDYGLVMRKFDKIVSGKKVDFSTLCAERMKTLAFVKIRVVRDNVLHIQKEPRVTLADQIANLGECGLVLSAQVWFKEGDKLITVSTSQAAPWVCSPA